MREHWRTNGPPVSVAVVAIAAALGVDLIGESRPVAEKAVDADAALGPSIVEMAKLMPVLSGHDTRAASRVIAEQWKGTGDGGQ